MDPVADSSFKEVKVAVVGHCWGGWKGYVGAE
jgi:hypothetical protein